MQIRTKLPPSELTRLILSGRGPRHGALGFGEPQAPIAAEPQRLGTVTPD